MCIFIDGEMERSSERAAGGTSADVDGGRVLGEHSGLLAVRDLILPSFTFSSYSCVWYVLYILLLVRVTLISNLCK